VKCSRLLSFVRLYFVLVLGPPVLVLHVLVLVPLVLVLDDIVLATRLIYTATKYNLSLLILVITLQY